VAQPASTALQIALVDLLDSVGVRPAAVIGHSSGEIAAAYAHGALSAAEAMQISYFRGLCAARLERTQQQPGAMIAVGLSEEDSRSYIDQVAKVYSHPGLEVACINSQKNVTVSGDDLQVESLKAILESRKIFARKLRVPVAYHSAHMEEIAPTYRELIGNLRSARQQSCHGIMVSSVTGQKVAVEDMRSPEYWVRNLVSPVQFSQAFRQICAKPGQKIRKKLDCSHRSQPAVNILLEVGPHAALQGPIRDLLETLPWGHDVNYSPVIRRGENAIETFLDTLGHFYCLGCPVDLGEVNRLSQPL
jgi:acyl transferase domain-containing protein